MKGLGPYPMLDYMLFMGIYPVANYYCWLIAIYVANCCCIAYAMTFCIMFWFYIYCIICIYYCSCLWDRGFGMNLDVQEDKIQVLMKEIYLLCLLWLETDFCIDIRRLLFSLLSSEWKWIKIGFVFLLLVLHIVHIIKCEYVYLSC